MGLAWKRGSGSPSPLFAIGHGQFGDVWQCDISSRNRTGNLPKLKGSNRHRNSRAFFPGKSSLKGGLRGGNSIARFRSPEHFSYSYIYIIYIIHPPADETSYFTPIPSNSWTKITPMRQQYFIISSYFHDISIIFPYISYFLCQVWPRKQRLTCCGAPFGPPFFQAARNFDEQGTPLAGYGVGLPLSRLYARWVTGGLVISVWVWICLDEWMSNPQKDGTDLKFIQIHLYIF